MFPYIPTRVSLAAIAVCAMMFAGCASWQGPRIDPTGEQSFAWPNQPPPAVVAPPGLPPGSCAALGRRSLHRRRACRSVRPQLLQDLRSPRRCRLAMCKRRPFILIQHHRRSFLRRRSIPPVPYAPATAIPGTVSPSLPAATVTPAVPIVAPVAGAPPAPTTPPGSTFVRLTPDRLVAPVGTEVFLKAGVAAPDGTLTPNERIEWSVARNGVGQLGSMGLHDGGQLFTWWVAPEKIDPWTAVGRTAFYPISVDRHDARAVR